MILLMSDFDAEVGAAIAGLWNDAFVNENKKVASGVLLVLKEELVKVLLS